jgi:hypothetical protein
MPPASPATPATTIVDGGATSACADQGRQSAEDGCARRTAALATPQRILRRCHDGSSGDATTGPPAMPRRRAIGGRVAGVGGESPWGKTL